MMISIGHFQLGTSSDIFIFFTLSDVPINLFVFPETLFTDVSDASIRKKLPWVQISSLPHP